MPTQLTLAGVRSPRSLARSPWRREIDDDRGEEERRLRGQNGPRVVVTADRRGSRGRANG